ncbi:MAG: GNAT family N-acetyltransferase [Synechococcaceae cyanobacterium SM2_3_1]|nr:GNAT family N-acetyltransferase [Synechococcaceae cyanobacterium SM2_3_1]
MWKLRPAEIADVESLFEIRCSVIENHQSREELAELGITPETVVDMIQCGDYMTTLAEVSGKPVGFTMAQISEGYIFACFVKPEFVGQGIGRALMQAAEEGLRQAGAQQAWLSTGSEPHLRAIGFYKHLGWIEDGYLEDGQIRFIKTL